MRDFRHGRAAQSGNTSRDFAHSILNTHTLPDKFITFPNFPEGALVLTRLATRRQIVSHLL